MRAAEIREQFCTILAVRRPQHLVHVGAHDGAELGCYRQAGIPRVTAVEPIPDLAAKLRAEHPDVIVVECACSDSDGFATLHIPAKSNMASLEGGDGHAITVPTRRLDDIAPDADAAVVDVQGHEMRVLAAAPWTTLRLVMVETLHGVDDPTLSPPYDLVVSFMAGKGFAEVARYSRDYDWIQRWAYGRTTSTGAEVRDVVFAKDPT